MTVRKANFHLTKENVWQNKTCLCFKLSRQYKNNLIRDNTYNLFNSYNKTIMIFNLLPIIPLDGYIFLRSILEYIFSYKKTYYISLIISIISIILFISYNEIFSLNNYLIISFLIYIIVTSIKEFKYIYIIYKCII